MNLGSLGQFIFTVGTTDNQVTVIKSIINIQAEAELSQAQHQQSSKTDCNLKIEGMGLPSLSESDCMGLPSLFTMEGMVLPSLSVTF